MPNNDLFEGLTVEGVISAPKVQPESAQKPTYNDLFEGLGTKKQISTGGRFQDLAGKGKEAGFLSQAESYLADDPATRIRILAENRFPDMPEDERLNRYRMTHDGEIAYVGDDGDLYRETSGGLKGFAAEVLGHAPTEAGAIIGAATGGPLGALAGAGIGESIRQGIAPTLYGQPVNVPKSLGRVGIETALVGVGGVAERIGGSGVRSAANRAMRPSASLGYDPVRTAQAYSEAHKRGVQLTPAEASRSRSLAQQQSYVADQPQTADQLGQFYEKRSGQVETAIKGQLDSISPTRSIRSGNIEAAKAFKAGKEKKIKQRTAAASPYYKAAENDPVDIEDIVEEVNQIAIQHSGTPYGGSFRHAYNSLTQKDEAGERIAKGTVGKIQEAKESIDHLIEIAKSTKQKARLTTLKKRIVGRMEKSSPEFSKGRAEFMGKSPPVNTMENSPLNDIFPKKPFAEPDYDKASAKIFGKTLSPENVAQARRLVKQQDPEAWDAVVKSHLLSKLESVKESAMGGGIANLGGQYRKAVLGSVTDKRKLRNALTPLQFKTLHNFSDLLKNVSLVTRGQSMTQPRQEMAKAVAGGFKDTRAILLNPRASAIEFLDDRAMEKNLNLLADLITNTKNMVDFNRNVQKLRKYAPNTKRFAPSWYEDAITAAFTSLGAVQAKENF